MTPTDIQNIRTTFATLSQDPDGLASEFYARLFESAPSVRPLFKEDLRDQGNKLVGMLAVVVHGLDRLDAIIGAVQALGRRHVAYGVCAEHYALVGAALLATLESRLGAVFTEDVRSSWASAYGFLSTIMRTAQTSTLAAA